MKRWDFAEVSEFAKGLKDWLREGDSEGCRFAITGQQHDTWSDPATVDWEELDKAIDAFCAEFKAKRAK